MDYDDWLFDSVRKYKNLSMYDMQQNVTAMDWVNGKNINSATDHTFGIIEADHSSCGVNAVDRKPLSIINDNYQAAAVIIPPKGLCVATSCSEKHEIVELLLPDKMLGGENTGKLKKDRDFRVNAGGFSSKKVEEVKHIPNSRYCVVSEQNESGISIWEMGNDDTDLMSQYKTIAATSSCHPTRLATIVEDGSDNRLAFGSCQHDITVVDVNNFQKIRDTSDCGNGDQVTALFQQAQDLLTTCTRNGDISLLDLRCKTVIVSSHKNPGKSASFWTMSNVNDQSKCLLQLSSGGEVLQIDTRTLDKCVVTMDTGFSVERNYENLTIQDCPGDKFSISGFDGLVHVYIVPQGDQSRKLHNTVVKPVFSHEGHVMNSDSQSVLVMVAKHMWHPWQQDLIISCATDGSLHAWQYCVKHS